MKFISNYNSSYSKSYLAVHLVVTALFFISQYFILAYLKGFWFALYLGMFIVYLPFIMAAYVYWNFDMHVSRAIKLRQWGEDKVINSPTQDLTPLGNLCDRVVNFYTTYKLTLIPVVIILNIWIVPIFIDIAFGRKIGGADWRGAGLNDEDLKYDYEDK